MKSNTKQKYSTSMQIAAGIIIIAGMMAAQSIVVPIILSIFLSTVLTQPIQWLEKKKIPWGVGMIIILLVGWLLLISLGGIIGTSISNFLQDAPNYEETLREMIVGLVDALNKAGANINSEQLVDLIDPGKLLSFTAGAVRDIGKVMSDSFVILLIVIFMLLEVKSFMFKAETIHNMYGYSLKYFEKIGSSIRHYLSIKTVISLLTGIFIWIWLLVIGIDYAILWGVIAFLLNYIPSIGSIIAAVPTVLLALLTHGVGDMIWTGVGYLIVNMVMGNIVEPRVMGRGLGLSTLVVFLSLIIWGFVLGTVGMFLSVPLTISIKIMLEQNESTRWIAVLLGTVGETKRISGDEGASDE